MSIRTATELKALFGNGMVPDEDDYGDLIDSSANQSKDLSVYLPSGYVTDGSVDYMTQIQAAITAGAGGEVLVPAGTFGFAANLTIPSNTTLRGIGPQSILKKLGNDTGIELSSVNQVTIKDLTLDGASATYTTNTNNAIYVLASGTGVTNLVIEGVTIKDWAGAGIMVLGQVGAPNTGIKITENTLENIGTWGILCQGYCNDIQITGNKVEHFALGGGSWPGITAGRTGTNLIIANNIITGDAPTGGASAHGISADGVTSGANGTITGNLITNTVGYGIEMGFLDRISVTGNVVEGKTRAAIAVTGTSSASVVGGAIVGNTLFNCELQGIYAFAASGAVHTDLTISGNSITGNGTSSSASNIGIYLTYVHGATVSGNTVRGFARSGIYANLSKWVMVSGNSVVSNNTSNTGGHAGIALLELSAAPGSIVSGNYLYGNGVLPVYTTLDAVAQTLPTPVQNAQTPSIIPPSATQTLTAVGDTISVYGGTKVLLADGVYTMTSTPTIAAGTHGQQMRLFNLGTNAITIQDNGTLAGSTLRLVATTVALSQRDSVLLEWNDDVAGWVQIGLVVPVI
jgi:parallel beta-helix repeat protein